MNDLYNEKKNVSMRKLGMDEMAEINGGGPFNSCGGDLGIYAIGLLGVCIPVSNVFFAIISVVGGVSSIAGGIYQAFEYC